MSFRLYLTFFVLAVVVIVTGLMVGKELLLQIQKPSLPSRYEWLISFKNNSVSKDIIRRSKAAEIASLLDKNVDPCDNFYRFSCGSWSHHFPAQLASEHYRSKETLLTNKFELLFRNTKHRLQSLFIGDENLSINQNRNSSTINSTQILKNIRSFYRSCTKISTNINLYKSSLKEIYSGFTTSFKFPVPSATKRPKSKEDWWSLLAQIQQKYNQKILFDVEMFKCKDKQQCYVKRYEDNQYSEEREEKDYNGESNENGEMDDIEVEEQILTSTNNTVPSKNTFDKREDERLLYIKPVQIIEDMLSREQIGIGLRILFDLDESKALQLAKKLIEMDKAVALALSSTGKRQLNNRKGVKYDLDDLCDRYESMFDLRRFIEIAHNTSDNQLPATIYVINEQYLINLENIIEETDETVIISYILWKLMKNYIVAFHNFGDGSSESGHLLAETCFQKTEFQFRKHLQYLFYHHLFEQRNDVHQMWQEIKSIFHHKLRSSECDFLTNHTREMAIAQLEAMYLYIDINEDELINFKDNYTSIQFNEHNFLLNVRNLQMQLDNRQQSLEDWLKANVSSSTSPIAPSSMSFVTTSNQLKLFDFEIIYEMQLNRIKFPFGLLQSRYFWAKEYPSAIRYATLGYLLAHQMIQGYLGQKRHFRRLNDNATANGKPSSSWWDEQSNYEYSSRLNCFQYQLDELYRSKILSKNSLPKDWQLDEVVSKDVTALQIAYKAFKNHENLMKRLTTNNNSESVVDREMNHLNILPNLKYTNNQLFFINFAQLFCEDVEKSSRNYLTNSYTPAEYRVIASLVNCHDFAWSFDCMIGSPMQPPFKCAIY